MFVRIKNLRQLIKSSHLTLHMHVPSETTVGYTIVLELHIGIRRQDAPGLAG